jgi:methyl-accepting chemotaxis protein
VGRIVALTERSRGGDLTIVKEDFRYNGGGELRTLVEAMSDMVAAQLDAVTQTVQTSDQVADHAAALSRLSEENASVTSRFGALIRKVSDLCGVNTRSVEQGASSIAEMTAGANSVATMSVNSAESLAKTTQISQLAASAVTSLVDDINRVDGKTAENQEKIRVLSSSVTEISNFMGVIGSIADQTNLLALNAAIEAARAGDAGRGFAVVAEEVRKLAEESRNASRSVEGLVTALSRDAGQAISASEESVVIVKEIMSKASVTVQELDKALSEITRANDAIQSIAAVAQEQAASSTEMSHAMEAIRTSTEEISESLKELSDLSAQTTETGKSVSDSALQMSQGIEELNATLAHFKIE